MDFPTPEYEVIIPTCPKDYNKTKFAIQSLSNLSPQPNKIHIVSPNTGIRLYLRNTRTPIPMAFYTDDEALPQIKKGDCPLPHRSGWVWQQFLKLFNDLTKTDYYLVVDSDLYFNKPLEIFIKDEGKPKFFLGLDQEHTPYFNTTQKLWGFGREYNHSFINDFMMFDKTIADSLIGRWCDSLTLYETVCKLIGGDKEKYSFSEFESYGNFCHKYYEGEYDIVNVECERFVHQRPWKDEEIESLIRKMRNSECSVFTFHSWI